MRYVLIFKLLIGLTLCLLIYVQLTDPNKGGMIFNYTFQGFGIKNYIALFGVIILIPFNWLFEALKWKLLLRPLIKIPLKDSFKAILMGLSLGIITPARVGEYGGRMLVLPLEKRIASAAATFLSSMSQNFFHLIFGFIFSYYFLKTVFPATSWIQFAFMSIVFGGIIFIGFIIFYPEEFWKLGNKINWLAKQKWFVDIQLISSIDAQIRLKVLVFSAIRYGTYFFQYFLLLIVFNAELTHFQKAMGISTIYLVQTGIPLPPLLGLLGRGELAIVMWAYFGMASDLALLSTFSLWLANLVLPAMVGYFFIIRFQPKQY